MAFKLRFTTTAKDQLDALATDQKKLKKVRRCLGLIETDPQYSGLQSHKYSAIKTEDNRPMWQSYVENKTPAVWRVFWYYGPAEGEITIFAITPHP